MKVSAIIVLLLAAIAGTSFHLLPRVSVFKVPRWTLTSGPFRSSAVSSAKFVNLAGQCRVRCLAAWALCGGNDSLTNTIA